MCGLNHEVARDATLGLIHLPNWHAWLCVLDETDDLLPFSKYEIFLVSNIL